MKLQEHEKTKEFLIANRFDNDIERICSYIDEDKILEKKCKVLVIGCLEEPLANILAELGHDVTGVDLRAYDRGDIPNGYEKPLYKHIVGDFLDVLFLEKFDLIISVSVIEHAGLGYYKDQLSPDADVRIMEKAFNLLSPNGRFYLTVPVGGSFKQTKHWKRYTPQDIKDRFIRSYKVHRKVFFQTSYLGKETVCEADVEKYHDSTDISVLLTLGIPTPNQPKKVSVIASNA